MGEQPSTCDTVVKAILCLQENTVTSRPDLLILNCEPELASLPKLKIKNFTPLHKLNGIITVQSIMYYLKIMLAKLKEKVFRSKTGIQKLHVPTFESSNLNRATLPY